MAYTTINKSTDYFNTKLYTGNGSTNHAITGVGFQPDLNWTKARTDTDAHTLTDAVRGATKYIESSATSAEATNTEFLKSFDSDGFTLGNNARLNYNNYTYVSWNWKAGGASTTTPSGGTIATTVSANTTAGFSIFTYTGSGNAAHLAHGLGVAPTLVLIKGRSNTDNWFMKHPSLNANQYLYLNDTASVRSGSNIWSNTNPDATKIYVGTDGGVNGSGTTYVGYAFAEKTGYSKFGKYTGNGNNDGAFIYTGFKPAWLMIKRTDTTDNWLVYDNKRLGYNPNNSFVEANSNSAESASDRLDILSNGFKPRYDWTPINASGGTYVYMAFGQSLVGTNNIPATAR